MVSRIQETLVPDYPSAEEVMHSMVSDDIMEAYEYDPSKFWFIINGNNRTAIRKANDPESVWVSHFLCRFLCFFN